jgi:hypothetical protein
MKKKDFKLSFETSSVIDRQTGEYVNKSFHDVSIELPSDLYENHYECTINYIADNPQIIDGLVWVILNSSGDDIVYICIKHPEKEGYFREYKLSGGDYYSLIFEPIGSWYNR